jgi:hypothetical protein
MIYSINTNKTVGNVNPFIVGLLIDPVTVSPTLV